MFSKQAEMLLLTFLVYTLYHSFCDLYSACCIKILCHRLPLRVYPNNSEV